MSKLNIVGTSIGNIEDLTLRSIKLYFESEIILAEDTRIFFKLKSILKERYSKLLEDLNINPEIEQRVLSYREQNHDRSINSLLDFLKTGKDLTLVSDSGMPTISDPGWNLIEDVIKANYEIDVIPGPTAFSTALILSGLSTDRFTFLGFLPRKAGKMTKLLERYLNEENTVIFYESPFRIIKTLETISSKVALDEGQEIQAAACGEMTKKFQKVYRGTIGEVVDQLNNNGTKGEWVVCLRTFRS